MLIKKYQLLILCVAISVVGFGLGIYFQKVRAVNQKPFNSLRQTGYKYISPLLLCDRDINSRPPQLSDLNNQINSYLEGQIRDGDINAGSVLFRDFSSNLSLIVNPNEEYVPASLFKIPMMVALFKSAETDPKFLAQFGEYKDGSNNNEQFIKPLQSLLPGNTYTVGQGIEMMIRYSDNNSLNFLNHFLNSTNYQSTFTDLKIPLSLDASEKNVLVNIESYSYFFRTLYNATYLNREYSEKALELLTQTDYHNGLVAGVPASVPVAHKFGSATITEADKIVNELHDCGIVYNPDNHYLLCIMTKSNHPIPKFEHVIADLSKMVYAQRQAGLTQ